MQFSNPRPSTPAPIRMRPSHWRRIQDIRDSAFHFADAFNLVIAATCDIQPYGR